MGQIMLMYVSHVKQSALEVRNHGLVIAEDGSSLQRGDSRLNHRAVLRG